MRAKHFKIFLPSFKKYVLCIFAESVQYSSRTFLLVAYLLYPTWRYRYSTKWYRIPTWRYRYSTIFSFYAWHIGMNRLKISESHDTHWLGLIFKEAYQKCWLSKCVRHTVKSHYIAIPAEKNNCLCIYLVGYRNDIHSVNVTLKGH